MPKVEVGDLGRGILPPGVEIDTFRRFGHFLSKQIDLRVDPNRVVQRVVHFRFQQGQVIGQIILATGQCGVVGRHLGLHLHHVRPALQSQSLLFHGLAQFQATFLQLLLGHADDAFVVDHQKIVLHDAERYVVGSLLQLVLSLPAGDLGQSKIVDRGESAEYSDRSADSVRVVEIDIRGIGIGRRVQRTAEIRRNVYAAADRRHHLSHGRDVVLAVVGVSILLLFDFVTIFDRVAHTFFQRPDFLCGLSL